MPLFSARKPRQKFSRPIPTHVIGPMPVMTARRLSILGFGFWVGAGLAFKIHLHPAQRPARDRVDKSLADDRLYKGREQPNAKAQVVDNFD
jgi:hypothetical protein